MLTGADIETAPASPVYSKDNFDTERFLGLKNRFKEVLKPYKVEREQMPKVFGYVESDLKDAKETGIYVLDKIGLEALKPLQDEIYYLSSFLSSSHTRGMYIGGFDAVLIRKGETSSNMDRIVQEATVVHELAHSSAANVLMFEVKDGDRVRYMPTRIGLEVSTSVDTKSKPDKWLGMFLEEGFAQYHAGNFIDKNYLKEQMEALRSFSGKSDYTFVDESGKRRIVCYRGVGQIVGGAYSGLEPLVMDPNVVTLTESSIFFTPPAFAATTFGEMMSEDSGFLDRVNLARRDPKEFGPFWQGVKRKYPQFYERFYHGSYVDPSSTQFNFRNIAFDFYDPSKHEPIPKVSTIMVN